MPILAKKHFSGSPNKVKRPGDHRSLARTVKSKCERRRLRLRSPKINEIRVPNDVGHPDSATFGLKAEY